MPQTCDLTETLIKLCSIIGASFAGGYETKLGVTMKGIERAVVYCFSSCLDHRVVAYKHAHGFDIHSPSIAIVVQKQVNCAVAGVGFSVDPISNSYDHIVINANFGLGETVVAGEASPDQYTVHKYTGEVLERIVGAKETAIWLNLDTGGTEEKPVPELASTLCLSDHQVRFPLSADLMICLHAYRGG